MWITMEVLGTGAGAEMSSRRPRAGIASFNQAIENRRMPDSERFHSRVVLYKGKFLTARAGNRKTSSASGASHNHEALRQHAPDVTER
jgi:hypothetical protein